MSSHTQMKQTPEDSSRPSIRSASPPSIAVNQAEVRAAIVAAAVELFYKQGYEATSVREIVDHAGYTKGALYHYFDSKEEILLEIHDAFMSYGLARGREIAAGRHSPRQALALVMRELLRQVSLYRPHMTIFFHEGRHVDFTKYPEAKAKRDEWENILVEIIDRGVEQGEFQKVASSRVLSYGVTGTCVWAYHWFNEDGSMHIDEISDMFVDMVLKGLLVE
jgi:TetR/AcrR family transcriptional regulator, cholesterol catabolism regulator